MKILKQESPTCRIVQRYSLSALGRVVCRQRKNGLWWRTTSWLYTNQRKTVEGFNGYTEFFDIEEPANKNLGGRQF